MVLGPASNRQRDVSHVRGAKQLELPFEIPGENRAKLRFHAKDFVTGFAPKLGASLLMRVGVPMVAATTPAVIRLIDRGWEDDIVPNLVVGSALGGVWGAGVGALIPRDGNGVRISRLRSVGTSAAGGILLAPAVALVSKYVADLITAPIRPLQEQLSATDWLTGGR